MKGLSSMFKVLKNLGKIKEYATYLFLVVIKLRNIIGFLEEELNDTILGKKMAEYLPKVKDALNLVIDKVKKILSFLGEEPSEEEASALGESDIDSELKELEELLNKLRGSK